MRKFRGLTKDGKWVCGCLYEYGDSQYIVINKPHAKYSVGYETKFLSHGLLVHPAFQVLPETVGQQTGLKDKNGKESYYKDISQDEDGDKYSIEWDEKYACFYLKGIGLNCLGTKTDDLELLDIKEQEIIGTIHENLDLLETSK